jgi:membrane protein YdbS with pleckstrin-like domain
LPVAATETRGSGRPRARLRRCNRALLWGNVAKGDAAPRARDHQGIAVAMSYLSRVLQPGEQVVYTTRLHWLVYFRAIVLLAVAIVALGAGGVTEGRLSAALKILAALVALLALSSGFGAFMRRLTTELAITDHRVIYKRGFFSRHTIEINRSKVESVDVDQSILGRIFGYGTVIVRGTGGSLEPLHDIGDPIAFRTHITMG